MMKYPPRLFLSVDLAQSLIFTQIMVKVGFDRDTDTIFVADINILYLLV